MDTIPYSEVRAQLAETLKRLETRDEAIYVSRRGRPAGVLMSVAQYQRLQGNANGQADGPAARLLAWRARYVAPSAGEPWVDPFADVRDRRSTRRITWPDDLADPA